MQSFSELAPAVQDATLSLAKEGLDRSGQRHCILIVDDDPGVLMLVSKMVCHLGFQIKTAVNGLEALDAMEKVACRLVITDDEMPAMDGYQLAEQIQKKHLGTPVIIMSALQEGERLNELVASGLVAALLLKPFNLNMLRETIQTVSDQDPDQVVC
jgi:CheY-like chemotaxis protein